MKTTFTEHDFQKAITERLKQHKQAYPSRFMYLRASSGRGKAAQARNKAYTPVGWPDTTLVIEGGKTVYVELKRAGQDPSPEQWAQIYWLRARGFTVHVIQCETPGHAKQEIDRILKEAGVI